MESFLVCLLFVAITVLSKMIDYLIKSNRNDSIFRMVAWIAEREKFCVYKDVNLRSEELIYYVEKQQIKMSIPKDFCIDFTNKDENAYVEKILNIHKDYVIQQYFSNFLSNGVALQIEE